jgi:SAM-dependent methyltransferase
MGEWFENEALWKDFYPFLFAEERLRLGADEAAQALALAGITAAAGKAALDLCCGPGRHAVPLAQRGLRVTGVDRAALLLDRARERASLAAVEVEWVQADMREFRRPAAYDLALSLFTSFGFFAAPEDDLLVLRNVRHSLRPGGVLVMDLMGKENLARVFQPTRSRTLAGGAVLVERCQVVEDWTATENQWLLIQGDRVRAARFRLRMYSGSELRDRLREAGFATVSLHGGLDGSPYGLDAARLVAVARAGD